MTDTHLRELERRFKESGSPEDETAWLIERTRSGEKLDWESYSRLAELNVETASEYLLARVERGELEREKLELAAYCSHEPARVALMALGAKPPRIPDALSEWAFLFAERYEKPVSILVAYVATGLTLERWERDHGLDSSIRGALQALRRWLQRPTDEHALQSRDCAQRIAGRDQGQWFEFAAAAPASKNPNSAWAKWAIEGAVGFLQADPTWSLALREHLLHIFLQGSGDYGGGRGPMPGLSVPTFFPAS